MIQIVAPHLDDAILSLGGSMKNWVEKDKKEVKVLYVFSISDWTNPEAISGLKYEADREKVTAIRKLEEKRVSEMYPYSYEYLDYLDMPIRDQSMDNQLKEQLKKQILETLDFSFPVYFPLASGQCHLDHKIVRELGFELLEQGLTNLRFYEDQPYVGYESSHIQFAENLVSKGLKPEVQEIDMDFKFKCINSYDSQISPDWECISRAYNYSPSDGKYYERYWVKA